MREFEIDCVLCLDDRDLHTELVKLCTGESPSALCGTLHKMDRMGKQFGELSAKVDSMSGAQKAAKSIHPRA